MVLGRLQNCFGCDSGHSCVFKTSIAAGNLWSGMVAGSTMTGAQATDVELTLRKAGLSVVPTMWMDLAADMDVDGALPHKKVPAWKIETRGRLELVRVSWNAHHLNTGQRTCGRNEYHFGGQNTSDVNSEFISELQLHFSVKEEVIS